MLLNATDVQKSFPGTMVPVLQHVSFHLDAGETLAVLGASGGGKTTLLRMIAGLEKPTSGTIGGRVTRPGPDVGYMGQGAPLAPWLTALDNALLPARLANSCAPTHKDTARRALMALDLDDAIDKYPAELSGGMQQRVALAGMLTLAPQLYLLDEPLGQLDIPLRRRAADLLRSDVVARRAGAIIVTHSIEEALFIADRIIVLARPHAAAPARIAAQYSVREPLPGHTHLDKETAYHTVLQTLSPQVAA